AAKLVAYSRGGEQGKFSYEQGRNDIEQGNRAKRKSSIAKSQITVRAIAAIWRPSAHSTSPATQHGWRLLSPWF
ncbi:MAG: hypothetical protein AB7H71_19150, partial [Alphaproteobacteria bacterium]